MGGPRDYLCGLSILAKTFIRGFRASEENRDLLAPLAPLEHR